MQQEQEWSEVQTEKPEKEKIEFEVEKDEPKKEEVKQEVKAPEPQVKKEEPHHDRRPQVSFGREGDGSASLHALRAGRQEVQAEDQHCRSAPGGPARCLWCRPRSDDGPSRTPGTGVLSGPHRPTTGGQPDL